MATKRAYVLGPGGVYGRVENGKLITYVPTNRIVLTDKEADSPQLKGRITLLAEIVKDTSPLDDAVVEPGDDVVRQPLSVAAAVTVPVIERDAEDNSASIGGDLAKIRGMPAADALLLIDELTTDQLKLAREAEKARKDHGRRSVLNAITSRARQLNMAKARSTREANLAAKRGEADITDDSTVSDADAAEE